MQEIRGKMPESSEIKDRIKSLQDELKQAIEHYRRLARRNYGFALLLMTLTLAASAVAGVGGLFFGLSGQITGGLALLPGILALVATVLKPQDRANWHYRKKDDLNALRRRLTYELPESPSPDNVAAISSAWSDLDKGFNEEWEKNFALNWSPFSKADSGGTSGTASAGN
jgi:hypothetical protein